MISKEEIQKLKCALKKGDQKAISVLAGFSDVTINKFFNGSEDLISDKATLIIIEATAKVIKKRSKLKAASERIMKSI